MPSHRAATPRCRFGSGAFVFLAISTLLAACTPAPSSPHPDEKASGREPLSAPPASGHLLLVLELEGTALRVLHARHVDLPLPKLRAEVQPTPWRLHVQSASGTYEAKLPRADLTRGEFHGDDGQIEAVRLDRRAAAFIARIPALPPPLKVSLHEDEVLLGTALVEDPR